jgi:hypothetical protein
MEKLDVNVASANKPNQSNFIDGECSYCKKPDHRLADCYKRKRANERVSEQDRSFEKSVRHSSNRSGVSGNSRSSHRCGASSNSLLVNAGDSDSVDSNTVEAQEVHLNSVSNSVPLLKRSVRVEAFGAKVKVVALFNGAQRIRSSSFRAFRNQ